MQNIANIATIISGVMDIVLFVIAIYTFCLTFISNKISLLTFGESFDTWKSDTMNFIIKNKTLKTLVISKIFIVFDNKYRYEVANYKTPKVLEPLSILDVETQQYTSLHPKSTLKEYYGNDVRFHLEIVTDENKIIYTKHKNAKKYKIRKEAKLEEVGSFVSKLNGVVLKPEYVYAVHYKFQGDDELKTAFVDHCGKVSTYDFGFNAVPKEALENVDTIKPFFTDSGERLGIVCNVIKIEDIRKMVPGKMSTH